MISKITKVRRLSNLKRCSLFPVVIQQNVAEHSFYVSVLCLFVSEELKRKGVKLDEAKLLRYALLHDLDEAITGDIPYHVKKELDPTLSEYVGRTLKQEFDGICFEVDEDSLEYNIVKLCDYTELYLYCCEEKLRGNSSLDYVAENCKTIVNSINVRLQSYLIEKIMSCSLRDLFDYCAGRYFYGKKTEE